MPKDIKEMSVLLLLLRAGLWERKPDDLTLFPLADESWEIIFRMARSQTVTGIVYQGICNLPDEFLPPETILLRWVVAVEKIERSNRIMNRLLVQIYRIFRKHGLEPVLQKGQGVAAYYEKPLLRECGDIDFCFADTETAYRAALLVADQEKSVRKMPDGSVCYTVEGITVEHHVRLVDLYNPFVQNRLKEMEQYEGIHRFRLAAPDYPEGVDIRIPSPELNLTLLSAHILKHALGWGIGLRQLCDMARACYILHKVVSADRMRTISNHLHINGWNRLLYAYLVDYVGLSSSCLPYPEKDKNADALASIIWEGGNFGFLRPERTETVRYVWQRKMKTFRHFLKNTYFACRFAPQEGFWFLKELGTGQFKTIS